jgi:hypothetical protein
MILGKKFDFSQKKKIGFLEKKLGFLEKDFPPSGFYFLQNFIEKKLVLDVNSIFFTTMATLMSNL